MRSAFLRKQVETNNKIKQKQQTLITIQKFMSAFYFKKIYEQGQNSVR